MGSSGQHEIVTTVINGQGFGSKISGEFPLSWSLTGMTLAANTTYL